MQLFHPRSRLIKTILIAIAVIALGVGAKLYFFPAAKKPEFVTAPVRRANLEQTVLGTGTLQAFKQVSVGAQVSGQIKSLKVALGDVVKKGQLVAEIDSNTQQNNLRNAQAAVENVRAQQVAKRASLRQAELAFTRQKEMLAADATSREAYETAEATLNTTQAEIKALDAQIAQNTVAVDTANVNIGYTKILSPIDGVVVALVAQEGQTVNANQSAPTIIKVAQLDKLTVKTQISEADVVRVKPGQKVYFTILGEPAKRYYTTIRTVEPAPDSILTDTTTSSSSSSTTSATAIYYNALLDIPNEDGRLRISMTAQVYVVLAEARDALVVPSSAIGERARDGTVTVKVVDAEGKAVDRKVKVGINNNVNAQILEGLTEGEKVIVSEAPAPGAGGGAPRQGQTPRMRF